MPGSANVRTANKRAPKPGETGWIEESGNPVEEIISVHGDRVFFTMKGSDGQLRPATVQLWSRWKPPVEQFLIEIRQPKRGERVLHVQVNNGVREISILTADWAAPTFPETSLVILHQGTGFKP